LAAAVTGPTTAWRAGAFHLDPDGVVSRSDLILGSPNVNPNASMPLGNGSLGVAAWAANGFTAQLNRSDTMPNRKSPGQLVIPGLSVISHAPDFRGRLDLTTGVLEESGGGMAMKAWVSTQKDELVVDVSGADPGIVQTASVQLWSGRHPTVTANGTVGAMAETWVDGGSQGSGRTFGSMAAITAGGRNVQADVAGPTEARVHVTPRRDGTFRIVVASPGWTGGDAQATASALIGKDATLPLASLMAHQSAWWRTFWQNSGLIRADSADGSAAYVENLRTLYLYEEAASMKQGIYPGSQAGEADMFAWSQDRQTWTPSAYWLWNLRTQIAANMSSGNYQLNKPIFDMYSNDLAAIEAWTTLTMGGRPGACVPETMRFNGNGGDPSPGVNASCSEAAAPNWNALNISSGPEVSMYMWQQYLATGDRAMLRQYFPFMKSTARFLLAYQTVGADGYLHAVANAHETQWSVTDPTTDIAADQTLFPIIVAAAQVLGTTHGTDKQLVADLTEAQRHIPPYPRTDQATRTQLLNPHYSPAETDAADATGTDMLAISYEPAAQRRNGENVELEPLWPWNDISDQDAQLFALEQRSYAHRPNQAGNDWSMDAIDAARLRNPAEVQAKLVSITQSHQVYPNGFADLGSTVGYQPYIEQESGVATATNEALAQDYDGLIRFTPAWPTAWDVSGSVYLQHRHKVDVQVQNGELVTAAIEAGTTETVRVQNPWPGARVDVVNGKTGATVVRPTTDGILNVPVREGSTYLVQRTDRPSTGLPFASVSGTAATAAKHLGRVQLGLDPTADPTGTATVGTVVGSNSPSYGLTLLDPSASTAGVVDGLTARTADAGGLGFDVGDSVAATSTYRGTATVSYHDTGTGSFSLYYDAGRNDQNHLAGSVALQNSGTWRTATFPLSNAYLGGRSAGGADLRVDATGSSVTVHSVGLQVTGPWVTGGTLFPPAPTITSPTPGGTAKLAAPITGTTIPDGQVAVQESGSTLCTAGADHTGTWSCAVTGGLAAGRHAVSATVTDPTGLASPTSTTVSFTASDLPPGTAVVGTVVGPTNHSYGLEQDETPSPGFDGPTTASVVAGLTARTSTNSNIYFDISDPIAHAGYYQATFTISYRDTGTGSFAVQYDDGSSDPYRSAGNIALTNSNTWKTATVSASNAYFGGLQHSAADFRLRNSGGQVTVHSVAVQITGAGVPNETDFPPPIAITSPAPGADIAPTPTVTGTSEPDASVTVTADGNPLCVATASDDGDWSCPATTPLASGDHTLVANATDPTASPTTAATVTVHVP
jgi:hypothetical protein